MENNTYNKLQFLINDLLDNSGVFPEFNEFTYNNLSDAQITRAISLGKIIAQKSSCDIIECVIATMYIKAKCDSKNKHNHKHVDINCLKIYNDYVDNTISQATKASKKMHLPIEDIIVNSYIFSRHFLQEIKENNNTKAIKYVKRKIIKPISSNLKKQYSDVLSSNAYQK